MLTRICADDQYVFSHSRILLLFRENFRTLLCYQNGVFGMRGARTIFRAIRMTVFIYEKISSAERHHGLNSDDEAFDELFSFPRLAKVRHMRFFVDRFSHPVPGKVARKSEVIFSSDFFNRVAEVAGRIPYSRFCDTGLERFKCAADKFFVFWRTFPCDDGNRVVCKEPLVFDAEIDAHDIAFFYDGTILAGRRMHDYVVHGHAEAGRKSVLISLRFVSEKSHFIAVESDQFSRFFLKIRRVHAGFYHCRERRNMLCEPFPSRAQYCELFRRFRYHATCRFESIVLWMDSISSSPFISCIAHPSSSRVLYAGMTSCSNQANRRRSAASVASSCLPRETSRARAASFPRVSIMACLSVRP